MAANKLEASLRNALAKGDIHDAAFRRRVYEAAAAAMKRSLEAKGEPTAEAVELQTERLTSAIEAIEQQLRAAAAPRPAEPPPVQMEPPAVAPEVPVDAPDPVPPISPAAQQPTVEPPVTPPVQAEAPAATAAPGPTIAPDAPAPPEPRLSLHAEPRPEAVREAEPAPAAAPRRKRGIYAKLFSAVVVIAIMFAGLWWVFVSGAFTSLEGRDTSVPNPAPTLENDDFAGRDPGTASAPLRLEDIAAGEDGWVVLFTPSDPTVLRLQGAARAGVESDPFGDFARIITPGEDSLVQIGIPEGVLQRLAGQAIQIGILARSDEGVTTQMSVTCDLAEMGDCGRRRFNVAQSPTEFLFSVDLPAGVRPSRAGVLNIQTDIETGENAVLLLAVRMRGEDG